MSKGSGSIRLIAGHNVLGKVPVTVKGSLGPLDLDELDFPAPTAPPEDPLPATLGRAVILRALQDAAAPPGVDPRDVASARAFLAARGTYASWRTFWCIVYKRPEDKLDTYARSRSYHIDSHHDLDSIRAGQTFGRALAGSVRNAVQGQAAPDGDAASVTRGSDSGVDGPGPLHPAAIPCPEGDCAASRGSGHPTGGSTLPVLSQVDLAHSTSATPLT